MKVTMSIGAALMLVNAATGQEILNDPSEFSVPTALLDFETFPDGSYVPSFQEIHSGAWINVGVKLSRVVQALPWTFPVAGNSVGVHSGSRALSGNYPYVQRGGTIGFQFVLPGTTNVVAMTEAGIWVQHYVPPYPSTARPLPIITFCDANGGEIRRFVAREEDEFFGMRYSGGICGITITFSPALPDTGLFTVDNLQFGPVPAPTVSTERIRRGKIVTKWPLYYGAFQLQVAHHVNGRNPEKTKWHDVSAGSVLLGESFAVTNRITQGKYFRLVPPE
jgi:hypothetical protein